MPTDQRRICVSICERDTSTLTTAISRAAELGNLVEIRLDCFSESDLPTAIAALQTNTSFPTILTLRPLEQGGQRAIDLDCRIQFWRDVRFQAPAAFFDLEIDLAEQLLAADEGVDWSRVICSFHDFTGNSPDLDGVYGRLSQIPARVLKIAVAIEDAVDSVDIFKLLARAKSEGRELIAIGMGTAGIPTRVLGPSRGSFLTYAAFDRSGSTAPGQLTATELRDQYRIDQIGDTTQVTGLIGHPVSHSLSAQIHNEAFKSESLDVVYIPFEVRDLPAFMRRMVHPDSREVDFRITGLSVTSPYKRLVMDYLDWIDPAAKQIGAVNTLVIDDQGLSGYNTDAIGFITPLRERFGELRGSRCAVLGAGGGAHAAVYALLQEGAAVSVFVRNLERAKPLSERFGVTVNDLEGALFDGFDLIVNATVLGTAGQFEQYTPARAQQLRGARFAYDLVYNPSETQFLREARNAGCETLGGLPMFLAQAAEQFRLWTDREAPMEVMHAAAMSALKESV